MKKYTKEQLAKYCTITALGALQMHGIFVLEGKVEETYMAILMDLKTGSMERTLKQFDELTIKT